MPSGPAGPAVVVAVLTYRRDEQLRALLPELVRQAADLPSPCSVLVVDNHPDSDDPAGGARSVVEAVPQVRYAAEPRPGIAAARNRALDEAASLSADLLAFLDDDEVPVAGWLSTLVAVQRREGCTGVVGPVVSQFTSPPDPWVAAGRFFDRRRLPTGTAVDVAATNNLLLDVRAVHRLEVRFDERFGLSGGSDTLFTRQLVARGGRLVWCDEALVVDRVPAARVTRGWVLRRALRSGNSASRVALHLQAGRGTGGPGRAGALLATRARLLARGVPRLAGGAGRAALGVLTRDARHQARGLRTAARGAGMALGAFGWTYVEYRRTAA